MFHKVSLPPETHAHTKRDCRTVQDINIRKYPVLIQDGKTILKYAFCRFISVSMTLIARRKRDADFHLVRLIFRAMKATITD